VVVNTSASLGVNYYDSSMGGKHASACAATRLSCLRPLRPIIHVCEGAAARQIRGAAKSSIKSCRVSIPSRKPPTKHGWTAMDGTSAPEKIFESVGCFAANSDQPHEFIGVI
jgi:hypothetical protein